MPGNMRGETDNLVKHSVLVLGLTHIASIASLFFHVVMGRSLSKEEYAALASTLSVILICVTPMVAVQTTMAHFSANLVRLGRRGQIRRLLRSAVWKMLIFGSPLLLLAFALSNHAASALHLASSVPILIAACAVFASCFMLELSGTLQGIQSFAWMCVATHAWGIARLALGAALVAWVSASAVSGLAAHAVGMLASVAIGIAGVALTTANEPSDGLGFEQADRYFCFSLAAVLGFSTLTYADMILVKHFFANPEEYGNYARASTIARTLVFLPQPIAGALFPKVVSDGGGSATHARTLVKALILAFAITAASLSLALLFPRALLLALYKESSPSADTIAMTRLVSCAMAPLGLTFLLMNFELAQRRFSCPVILVACGLALVAGIVLFHASVWHVVAVLAIASLASFIMPALVLFRQARYLG